MQRANSSSISESASVASAIDRVAIVMTGNLRAIALSDAGILKMITVGNCFLWWSTGGELRPVVRLASSWLEMEWLEIWQRRSRVVARVTESKIELKSEFS